MSRDLLTISDRDIEVGLGDVGSRRGAQDSDLEYATLHLHAARDFVALAATEMRGFAYLIG